MDGRAGQKAARLVVDPGLETHAVALREGLPAPRAPLPSQANPARHVEDRSLELEARAPPHTGAHARADIRAHVLVQACGNY